MINIPLKYILIKFVTICDFFTANDAYRPASLSF